MNRFFKQPRLIVIDLLLILIMVGTGGYMLIEGWSFADAFYMTIITLTTIGFGEIHPMSAEGRIFTIGLIAVGVIIATYSISTIIELLTAPEFQEQIRSRRRRRELEQISQHCIICGYGRLGRSLANEMKARGAPFIVIDQDSDLIERCHQAKLPAIWGNAADERVLNEAGIERASSLVAAASSDAENVFIVLTAKSIKPDLHIIARCNSEASIPKIERAGASSVISPHMIAGRRIAHMLLHPSVTQFLDGILDFGGQQMRLEEFIISQNSPLAGLTLREARLKVAVLAVSHPEQTLLTHPQADTKLLPGAAIIAMGIEEELDRLAHLVADK